MINQIRNLKHAVNIGIIGKYTALKDAYLSVYEALLHGGYALDAKVEITWIDSENIEKTSAAELLENLDGIVIPGGFGKRGTAGKMEAIRHARENNIPFLGICYGMHLAAVEFATNVCGLTGASSTEIEPDTPYPIISLLEEQKQITQKGGTMRLGHYSCAILKDTKTFNLYQKDAIIERHRHRYEFNNKYKETLEQEGMVFAGQNPKRGLMEIMELPDHPYFIGVQFHPEFTSRPNRAHPLFRGLIEAALKKPR